MDNEVYLGSQQYFSNWFLVNPIGHFGKYHNNLCLSLQILHKHCFQFLLGLTMVPRENKNNAHAKFGGTKKSIMVFSEVAYLLLQLASAKIVYITH